MRLLPARRRESVPEVPLHGVGRRRRIRRIRNGPCGVRSPSAERLQRQRTCAAVVRRHHRLPVAAARSASCRRPAGHLRVRRQRTYHRAGRAGPRRRGTRDDAGRRGSAAGARAGRRVRTRRRRSATGAPRRCDPVRTCRRFGAAGAGGTGSWRDAGDRRDPSQRHSCPELPAASVPGASDSLGEFEYPRRRAGLPRFRRRAPHLRDHTGISTESSESGTLGSQPPAVSPGRRCSWSSRSSAGQLPDQGSGQSPQSVE